MKIIKTENLSVGYENKAVVDGIEISGLKGQVVCLLGPNGAGKTTILRTLSGLLKPVGGTVYINDKAVDEIKKKDLAKQLSVVLTERFSGGLMTVFEVVSMGRYPHTGYLGRLNETDLEKVWEALESVNAEKLSGRYFEELSDGERQKVLVARALVQEPEIIVLDEPTTHLDIRHRLELIEILKKLSKEKNITVILSLHEIDMALKSCDKVVLVKDSKIIGYGIPEDVVDETIIKTLFSIRDANFNNLLGSIEISNLMEPKVFVLGGNGYGSPVYRLLAKYGIGAFTGVIHRNDVDYEIARTMGMGIESEEPFVDISESTYEKAKMNMGKMDILVDTGFPVGTTNRRNIEMVLHALEKGKTVISMRSKDECRRYFGSDSERIINCRLASNIVEIIGKLEKNEYLSKEVKEKRYC
ncbi:iron complex transport system ATP-binding protein [Dethiosulfatibacter aminovorans DSM 17477]|uniref:Iron complex transport system ATP-binding protein n=1 Tax=Dethiosulfatibacter aminovorans DSM 17477 TaxID=1121476 RepID=A0A1M6LWQ2_9FIRM|nr:ABC transporter ATP-binding protein [Dethiosulfatibacter aminovorans]SHJ75677.1 iron complex transport system ATP-binding protein [Dethiosulfatibacter aminovorans DSM 17477]